MDRPHFVKAGFAGQGREGETEIISKTKILLTNFYDLDKKIDFDKVRIDNKKISSYLYYPINNSYNQSWYSYNYTN